MFKFSEKSDKNLSTCHPYLQLVFSEAIKVIDCSILEGRRSKDRQNELFNDGKSKLKWPNSKHNTLRENAYSMAVDAAPYVHGIQAIPWEEKEYFYYFSGIVLGIASKLGIHLRWGGDWNMNHDFSDQSFDDLVHFELHLINEEE